jgi:Rrf2 family transcriptional regulator, cysteine metabolism repressor
MRVTTKTIYALQLLLALAERARISKAPLHLREIAEAHGLPFKFLEQIAISLKGAGWIHGQRGKEGGYILSVDPSVLTLGQVIRLMEGENGSMRLTPSNPVEEAIEAVLGRCRTAIEGVVDATSLNELAADVHRSRPTEPEYQI